jgi:NADPH:quinone reductase-like Zn-dependent oxidoreductase
MKAAQINQYGDASVVAISVAKKPEINDDQALVEVFAASLNPFDTKIREGYMKEAIPLDFPVTLGGDIAGEVVEAGSAVNGLSVGDKVYGQAYAVAGNSGAFAEFAATKAGQVAKSPANLDFVQAASLPLVGSSALQSLKEHIRLKRGQKIFIHGGAGGIGSIAIQVAKDIGAHVATTATGEGINFVEQLGADETVDYKTDDFSKRLSGFDAVFDCVGGGDFAKSLDTLKPGGVAVSMIATVDKDKATRLDVTALTQSTKVNSHVLSELTKLVEAGIVKPQVDKVFPLDDIRQAFEARDSGAVRGKVVLKIK